MNDFPRVLTANRGDARRRLDLMLRRHLTDLHTATRTRVQAWIENGRARVLLEAPVPRDLATLLTVTGLFIPHGQ